MEGREEEWGGGEEELEGAGEEPEEEGKGPEEEGERERGGTEEGLRPSSCLRSAKYF